MPSHKAFAMTMASEKATAIFNTYSAASEPDRQTRDAAERTIQQQYQTDPTFFLHLFEFLVVEPSLLLSAIPTAGGDALRLANVQKLVALNFRNFILGRTFHNEYEVEATRNPTTGAEEQRIVVKGSTRMPTDWRKNNLILPEVRLAVRDDLINALLAEHVTEFVKTQLLSVVEHIINLELVSKTKMMLLQQAQQRKKSKKGGSSKKKEDEVIHAPWDGLVPALVGELNGLLEQLRHLGSADAPAEGALLATLNQHYTLLRVLRLCCKRVTNMLEFCDEIESESFYSVAVPIAVQTLALSSALVKVEYRRIASDLSARGAAGSLDLTTAPHTAATNACALPTTPSSSSSSSLSDLSSDELFKAFGTNGPQAQLLDLLNNVAYMSLKCLWPILALRTPAVLCDAADGAGFDQLCEAMVEAWRLRADLLYSTSAALEAVGSPASAAPLVPVELQLALTLRCAAASQVPAFRIHFSGSTFDVDGGANNNNNNNSNTNNTISPSDFSDMARASVFWSIFKWIAKICHNFQLHLGQRNRSLVDKNERPIAHRFLTTVATRLLPLCYAHLLWHHQPAEAVPSHAAVLAPAFARRLTSQSAVRCIELIEATVDTAGLYHGYVRPVIAAPLLTKVLLERLAYTEEDHLMWRENPEEYVRAQTGDTLSGRAISVRAVAMSCLLKLVTEAPPADPDAFAEAVKKQKKEQQQHKKKGAGKGSSSTALLLGPDGNPIDKRDPEGTAAGLFFSFLSHLFAVFQQRAASRAAGHEAASVSEQLAVDAAMYAIAEMRGTMLEKTAVVPQSRIEAIMTDYVFPELTASAPFLRARAVRLLSLFTRPRHMQWSSPDVYQHILRGALALLSDAELPVRMQACFCLSGFIQHPYAKPVVTPDIVKLVECYFAMMKEMDSDRVIRTLRKTIHCYADTLSQWAVQLCQFLVQHFSTLYSLSLQKSAEEEAREEEAQHLAGGSGGGVGGAIDALAAGGGGSSGGGRSGGGGPDFADVLEAADELMETLRTLIGSLPKNETPFSATAVADPSAAAAATTLAAVYAGIQRTVQPMVLHLLHAANPAYMALTQPGQADHGEGTSFSFLDGLLGMLTLLIEQSNFVVPEMWEVFSGLQGVVLHGGVADYFYSIIAPMDNMITVDVHGFLSHSGRSWKGVTVAAAKAEAQRVGPAAALAALPQQPLAQLLRDMCDCILLDEGGGGGATLRLSEKAAAAKIIECALLRVAYPPTSSSPAGGPTPPIVIAEEAKEALVRTLVPSAVLCATTRPTESVTFTYLLATVVFEGLLVHTSGTFAALAECHLPVGQFFQHVAGLTTEFLSEALSEADGSGPQILQMRQLQLLAALYAHLSSINVSGGSSSGGGISALVGGVVEVLKPLMPSVVQAAGMQTHNMITYAKEAITNAKNSASAGASSKGKKKGSGGSGGAVANAGDDYDSEDDDEDDDDDEYGGNGAEYDDADDSDDDGDDYGFGGDADGGGAADVDTKNVIQRLAKKAQALYGDADDSDDEDDGEADENQLEDFEASSVIDKVNVWAPLATALSHSGAGAELVGKASQLASMFVELGTLTDEVVQLSSS